MNYLELLQKTLEPMLADGVEVTLESTFKDLRVDSLDLVELVYELEEELNITFEDDELADLKNVGDVIQLIEAKKK